MTLLAPELTVVNIPAVGNRRNDGDVLLLLLSRLTQVLSLQINNLLLKCLLRLRLIPSNVTLCHFLSSFLFSPQQFVQFSH